MRGASWRSSQAWRPYIPRRPCRGLWTLRSGGQAPESSRFSQPAYQGGSNVRLITHVPRNADGKIEGLQANHRTNELNAILIRAPHGIDSLKRLAFEADLGHLQAGGSRLTDLPVNRHDLDLWLVLLEYRVLTNGDRGVQDILYGMRLRGDPVKLLDYDDASDRIWELSLAAASRNSDILFRICNPSDGIGRGRPTLFLDAVVPLLKAKNVVQAGHAATLLRTSHFRGRQDLSTLINMVLDDTCEVTLDDFCAMLHRLPFNPVYADIVPALCRSKRWEEGFRMHQFLLRRHDFPRTFEHIEPFVRQIAYEGRPLEPFLSQLEGFDLSFSAQARNFYAQVRALQSGATMEAISLSSLGKSSLRQRRLNDHLVARIFATQALSFEFALKSLKFFGLAEVGPLAVREIAASAKDIDDLQARFKMLEAESIDTGSSTFVTVLKNLCITRSTVLLRAILESDQHHDVLEDRETQRRLLAEYYHKKDWSQVNRTLAILNRGKIGLFEQTAARHLLLKSAIVVRNWRGALIQLANMNQTGYSNPADSSSHHHRMNMDSLVDMILSKGKQTNSSDKAHLDRLGYLIGVLQNMESCGIAVSTKIWRRVLFRLGNLSSFSQVESLSLWLASYYGRSILRIHAYRGGQASYNAPCAVGDLFDYKFHAAVMQWTICSIPQTSEDVQVNERGRRGLRFLRTLNEKFEVPLDLKEVRKAFETRLQSMSLPTNTLNRYLQTYDLLCTLQDRNHQKLEASQQFFRSPYFASTVAHG